MNIKNKNVLVTGADGFIGSHLVESLVKSGANVTAFVYYNSFNKNGWLDNIDPNLLSQVNLISGDIRDPFCVNSLVKNINIIFHLAALIGIPYSYNSPNSYVETNINGTLNILQAAKQHSVEKILVTSTSEVYGTAQFVPISEEHPKQGQSPYSATKIAADFLSESFFRSFNLPVTIVRPFNTFGPRQSLRAIIPTIINQLLNDETKIKLGALHPTRDLVYVKDTAQGFIDIAESEANISGEEINIATCSEISMQNLAELIIEKINPSAKIILDNNRLRPKKSEVERLFGDNKKIKKLTNWKQAYNLESGLQETIQWYKAHPEFQTKSLTYNI